MKYIREIARIKEIRKDWEFLIWKNYESFNLLQ